jgi:hypothetical protein
VKVVGCWNGLGKHVAAEDGMDISGDPQPCARPSPLRSRSSTPSC